MRPWEKLHARFNELGFDLDGTGADAPPTFAPTRDFPFAEELDVSAFEQTNGLRLPEDFREHLLQNYRDVAPFDDRDWLQFWPVTWLVTVPNETEHYRHNGPLESAHEYVHFADHFIRARNWVINCGSGPKRGAIVELGRRNPVDCGSFSEFVEIVVNDPDRLASF